MVVQPNSAIVVFYSLDGDRKEFYNNGCGSRGGLLEVADWSSFNHTPNEAHSLDLLAWVGKSPSGKDVGLEEEDGDQSPTAWVSHRFGEAETMIVSNESSECVILKEGQPLGSFYLQPDDDANTRREFRVKRAVLEGMADVQSDDLDPTRREPEEDAELESLLKGVETITRRLREKNIKAGEDRTEILEKWTELKRAKVTAELELQRQMKQALWSGNKNRQEEVAILMTQIDPDTIATFIPEVLEYAKGTEPEDTYLPKDASDFTNDNIDATRTLSFDMANVNKDRVIPESIATKLAELGETEAMTPEVKEEYLLTVAAMAGHNQITLEEQEKSIAKLRRDLRQYKAEQKGSQQPRVCSITVDNERPDFNPEGYHPLIDEGAPESVDKLLNKSTGLSDSEKEKFKALLLKYWDVFRSVNAYSPMVGVPTASLNFEDENATPLQEKFGRVKPQHQEKVLEHFSKLLKYNIVSPSTSPWSSPLVVARKKDAKTGEWTKLRFCVNYKKINDMMKEDGFRFQQIEDILELAGTHRYISSYDASSGFHQLMMDKLAKERSAFFVPGIGLLEWNTMPFGLKTAPALFCRAMSIVMKGLVGRCMGIVMDDFLVHSKNAEDHLVHTEAMLKRCRQFNLTLEIEKAQILPQHTEYCGHLVGKDGNRPDPKKLNAIGAWPRPTSRREIRGFIGLAGFYRKYIANFSRIARPMTEIMDASMDSNAWVWTRGMEQAFIRLKRQLLSPDVMLLRPDQTKDFVLATDWSKDGFGAVLCQLDDEGALRPLSFVSKAKQAKIVDDATQGEAEVVLWALDQFRHYIWGRRVVCYTDHQALVYLFEKLETKSNKIQRWVLRIQQYNVQFRHIRGKFNIVADALSREGSCSERFKELPDAEKAKEWADAVYELIYFDDDVGDDDHVPLPDSVRQIVENEPRLQKDKLEEAISVNVTTLTDAVSSNYRNKVIAWSPTKYGPEPSEAPNLTRGLWALSAERIDVVPVRCTSKTYEECRRWYATGGDREEHKHWKRHRHEQPPTADAVVTAVCSSNATGVLRELASLARDWQWRVGIWTVVVQIQTSSLNVALGPMVHAMNKAGFAYFAILERGTQSIGLFSKDRDMVHNVASGEMRKRQDVNNKEGEDLQLRGACQIVLRAIAESSGSERFHKRRRGPTESYHRRVRELRSPVQVARASAQPFNRPDLLLEEGEETMSLQPATGYPSIFRYIRPQDRMPNYERLRNGESVSVKTTIPVTSMHIDEEDIGSLERHDEVLSCNSTSAEVEPPGSRPRRANTRYGASVVHLFEEHRQATMAENKKRAEAAKAKRIASKEKNQEITEARQKQKEARQKQKEAKAAAKEKARAERDSDKAARNELQQPQQEEAQGKHKGNEGPVQTEEVKEKEFKSIGWIEAQRTDPYFRQLYEHITTNRADENGNYSVADQTQVTASKTTLENEVGKQCAGDFRGHRYIMHRFALYRLDEFRTRVSVVDRWLMVVPEAKKSEVLYRYHDSKEGGHDGYQKTMLAISEYFWWPKMLSEIKQYCKECQVCLKAKGAINSTHGLSRPLLPQRLFETISVDLHGPYPASRVGGYTYYLTAVDNLSTYPEVMFLKNAQKEEITLQLLLHVIARYGSPKHVICDNGSNLNNGHVYSALQMIGTELSSGAEERQKQPNNDSVVRYTSAYNPQSNTHAEFIQKQMVTAMRIMAEEHGGDQTLWPYAVAMRLPSLRSKPRLGMTYASHDMIHRRPLENAFTRLNAANLGYINLADIGLNHNKESLFMGGSEKTLNIMEKIAAWEVKEQAEERANLVNANRKEIVYHVGELVALKNTAQSDKAKAANQKLFMTFTGPYLVTNRYGKTYRLRKVEIDNNNTAKRAVRTVVTKEGTVCHIRDRSDVKEKIQVRRLLPWKQARDILPYAELPSDKLAKNILSVNEKTEIANHELKHKDAYRKWRDFVRDQWRPGQSKVAGRGAFSFFSTKETEEATIAVGVGQVIDSYVDWATGEPTVELHVHAVQYFHEERITTLHIGKDNIKEWQQQIQHKNRLLLTPTWLTSNPTENVTKRFGTKTALADPVKYARKLGWGINLVRCTLSQLRGEMFGEESFVVADEDIRQLVEGGAIELSPQIKMQSRIPLQAWSKLSKDKRIVSILRTSIEKQSLAGTGLNTRNASKRSRDRDAELQDPESQRTRAATQRSQKLGRVVQQRRSRK